MKNLNAINAIALEIQEGYNMKDAHEWASTHTAKSLRKAGFRYRARVARVATRASAGILPGNTECNGIDPLFSISIEEMEKDVALAARFGGFVKALAEAGALRIEEYNTCKAGVIFSMRNTGWNAGATDQTSWSDLLRIAERFSFNPGLAARVLRKTINRAAEAVRAYFGETCSPKWVVKTVRMAVVRHAADCYGPRGFDQGYKSLRALEVVPKAIRAVEEAREARADRAREGMVDQTLAILAEGARTTYSVLSQLGQYDQASLFNNLTSEEGLREALWITHNGTCTSVQVPHTEDVLFSVWTEDDGRVRAAMRQGWTMYSWWDVTADNAVIVLKRLIDARAAREAKAV